MVISGRPGGVSGYPRACGIIGQFREFEYPASAYACKFVCWDFFTCAQMNLRKSRERELATLLDDISTSSGIAEPYAR